MKFARGTRGIKEQQFRSLVHTLSGLYVGTCVDDNIYVKFKGWIKGRWESPGAKAQELANIYTDINMKRRWRRRGCFDGAFDVDTLRDSFTPIN